MFLYLSFDFGFRRSNAEHECFLQGVKKYGNDFQKIASEFVNTRTYIQLRSYGFRYFRALTNDDDSTSDHNMIDKTRDSNPKMGNTELYHQITSSDYRIGKYSAEEKRLIIEGVRLYRHSKDKYERISQHVKTRSPKSVTDFIYFRKLFEKFDNNEDPFR